MKQSQQEIDAREQRIANCTMISKPKNEIPANLYSCGKMSVEIADKTVAFLAKGKSITVIPSLCIASAKARMNYFETVGAQVVNPLANMPRKKYWDGYAKSEYTCKCTFGMRFIGHKKDNKCPLCAYKENKPLNQ